MSGRNIISRELSDSIRHCLGRKVKLSLKVIVKAEVKSDKFENRILGFSTCRLFVLTMKIPTRVDHHFHYLDIQGVESKKPNQLCLTVCDKHYSFYTANEDGGHNNDVDMMILHLGTALKNVFPSIPIKHIIRKFDVHPSKRMQALEDLERVNFASGQDRGPCGGFSDQYACMCDYHALPYRAEVAWDVDTIYLSHDTRELYLHDFDYLEPKDLIPIISALEYNTWFNKFKASHSKLSHEAVERILHVISKSLSLEEIFLDNIGAKADFANKLSLAILSNSHLPLQTLDISHNPIEDKGAVHISNPIGRQAKGLGQLNLAYCNLTSKGINMLAHSLTVNKYMSQTLVHLCLAGNSLKDEVNNLYNFLAQPNVLKSLDLAGTDCAIDAVFGALLRGCTTNLSTLNLSRNGFGSKKSKEMFPSFKQYFTSSIALVDLNVSHCKLPADALKNLLLGLACNESISDVKLDLSSNHLGSTGAQILESCIHGVRCLTSLNIADNGLENQLGPVVLSASKNKSIKTLNIGRNLNNIKGKHVTAVMEAVVHMLQEEDCVLETLIFNDSKLKTDLHSLLNALGSNRCLQTLDISGNYMGDSGARLLAKALQINSKLHHISYDKNGITLLGYSDIAYALQSNYSMKFMPFPVHDTMLCMKTAPDRTEAVLRKIQDCLFRNISPRKYSNGQAFRLQQGFILSSTHQVDRLVLQTGEVARTLKRTTAASSPGADTPSNVESLLEWSEKVISDAEKSKQLISHFHDGLRREGVANPIETKLAQVSQDLHAVIKSYVKDTVENMVRSAQDRCPNVLSEEKVVDEIRSICLSKAQVSSSFVEEAIVEQAGSLLLNRVNEVNLSIASTVSDRVIDEVVDSLSRTCKSLQTGEGPRRRAMTVDSERDRGSSDSNRSSDVNSQGDNKSQKSEPSPMPHTTPHCDAQTAAVSSRKKSGTIPDADQATPLLASKRKGIHGRKLRPQSVVEGSRLQIAKNFAVEGDSEKSMNVLRSASEERTLVSVRSAPDDHTLVSISSFVSDSSNLSSLSSLSSVDEKVMAESLDSVSELPSNSGQLQHLGKARPRRAKTRAPTRPMGRAEVLEEDHDISQGVDMFFRPGSCTPTTPVMSPESENSPRIPKYDSTSSMDSFPPTGQSKAGESDRDSSESLNRSDSEVLRDSPKLKTKSEDEEGPDEANEEEKKDEEKKSVSNFIAKISGGETVLKLSPDMSTKRLSSNSFEEKSRNDDEAVTPRKASAGDGFKKFGARGVGMGDNVLAEIKARQKRSSVIIKDEDTKKEEEKKDFSPAGGVLGAVKLRSTGLVNCLKKSPTNGLPAANKPSPKTTTSPGNQSRDSDQSDQSPGSLKDKPLISLLKPRQPPPPLGPKPRPKSAFVPPDYRTADADDEFDSKSHRSVRELAASLTGKAAASPTISVNDETAKKKTSSLPRNTVPPVAEDSSNGTRLASSNVKQTNEEAQEPLSSAESGFSFSFRRQMSHKHVLTSSDINLEDAVDV